MLLTRWIRLDNTLLSKTVFFIFEKKNNIRFQRATIMVQREMGYVWKQTIVKWYTHVSLKSWLLGGRTNLIGSMYGIFTYIIWLIVLMVNIGKHIIEVLYNSICQLLAFKYLFVWSVDGHGFYFFMEPHHQSVVQYRFVVSFFFVVKNVTNSPDRCLAVYKS